MSATAPANDTSATRRRWYDGHPAIAKGVKDELGNLANTQGRPEVGPWAKH